MSWRGKNRSKKLLRKEGIELDQIMSGIDNISVPIYIVSLQGKIIFANRTCAKLANLADPSELIGRRCYEIFRSENCYTSKCPLKIYTESIEVTDIGVTPNLDVSVSLPDGDIKYLRANHAPIYSEDGEVCGIIELFEDFTEIKESSLKIMDNMVSLAEGDLSKTLEVSELHKDFIEIGESLNTLSISLDLGLRNISDTVKQIAEGDFSSEVEWEMPGVYSEITNSINQAVHQLNTVIHQIQDVSTAIRDGDLDKMVDVSQLKGVFADIGNVINEMSISLDLGLRNISDTVKQIAEGDFSSEVEWEMPGIYREIILRINSALKNAHEVDKDRKEALEQLAANLAQFETSADRLRNPLAVIMTTLELKELMGKEYVLKTIEEHSMRIKRELDEMREEEIKTYELTEKSLEKL
ncbi:MAG: PAS domain-containing protein [Archaeoglobaceae archaeon]